jgi:hypothetical protein
MVYSASQTVEKKVCSRQFVAGSSFNSLFLLQTANCQLTTANCHLTFEFAALEALCLHDLHLSGA